jgi:L-ascorbate metabolism protein UlaG (beta-lactamase superfamily)
LKEVLVKITKLAHSCLLVEMPAPVNRTVLFDPGEMSAERVRAADLKYLDDIVISHGHFDHFNLQLVQELVKAFPEVRILAPEPVVSQLSGAGITASTEPSEGLALFDAPHEPLEPIGKTPVAIGVHYLNVLTHPGDSHHFHETKDILALPITAPWGATVNAAKLAAELKPRYIIPIHDWMWKDDWRMQIYPGLSQFFEGQGINFLQPIDGEPFVLEDVAVQTA